MFLSKKDINNKFFQSISIITFLVYGNVLFAAIPDSLMIEVNRISSDTAKIARLNVLGREFFRKDIEISRVLLEQALTLSIQAKSDVQEAVSLKNLGTACFYAGDYDDTQNYWKQSLEKYQVLEDQPGIADLYSNMGIIYQRTGQYDSSLFYYSQALEIRQNLKDTLSIANSYANLGAMYRVKGDFQKAIEYYHSALKIYESLGHKKQISDMFNSIGLVYMAINNYDKSLSYIRDALDLRMEIGDKRGVSGALNNIAGCYELLKDYDSAKAYYLEYLETVTALGDKRGVAGAFSNLGNIYKNTGEPEKSITHYRKAIAQFSELGDPEGQAIGLNNIARTYMDLGRINSALSVLDSALNIATEAHMIGLKQESVGGLSKAYELLGDYKQALKYKIRYSELHDSLFDIKSAERVAELQQLYEAEKRDKEIQLLKQQAVIKKQNSERQLLIRNWAIGATVLLLVALGLLFNRGQLKRKILVQKTRMLENQKEEYRLVSELKQVEVDAKNRELSAYATVSLQKNETLYEIREKLNSIKDINPEVVRELKHIVKSNINLDSQWDKFKLHFESVHPTFFSSLAEQFPQLSASDLKNCAYIKMKLSSKEVASLLNVDTKSAKMIRYRLKKKLNLSPDEDLQKFIESI